jgi:hypothetical protein
MWQVQPKTLLKNSNFSSCLQNIKLKNNTPKLLLPTGNKLKDKSISNINDTRVANKVIAATRKKEEIQNNTPLIGFFFQIKMKQ